MSTPQFTPLQSPNLYAIYKQGTVTTRVKRIEELGAIVKVTDLSYDETVEVARRMATSNDWIFIQDTTMENYLVTKSIMNYQNKNS